MMMDRTERRAGVEYVSAVDVPLNLPKHEIEQYGSKVAECVGRKPGLPVEEFIRKLGGEIKYEDTTESPDGGYVIVHGPRDFGVVLSTWTSPRRDQFTMAHELGHYALHSRFGECHLFAARTGSGQSEWEANWFAAGFLMPEAEFRDAVRSGISDAALAARFGVSVPAARIRKKALGLE